MQIAIFMLNLHVYVQDCCATDAAYNRRGVLRIAFPSSVFLGGDYVFCGVIIVRLRTHTAIF